MRCLILFGASDHVLYPDYDKMAAVVFPNHVGPFLLRDCGHFVPWEAPGPLVSGLVSFCGDRLCQGVDSARPAGAPSEYSPRWGDPIPSITREVEHAFIHPRSGGWTAGLSTRGGGLDRQEGRVS